MIDAGDVTACLVTRGDQPEMMRRIEASLLPYADMIVWNNKHNLDRKCAGRYAAAMLADTDAVYFQDDDVVVPQSTQQALLDAYEPGEPIVATWGHGENPDGYDDLPLVCGGAVASVKHISEAQLMYAREYPLDEEFDYEADFAIGVLYPSFRHLHLPFDINMPVAQHPSRLVNQPWQRDLKFKITERARAIRDRQPVAA